MSVPRKRIVTCPQCGSPSEFSPENKYRPFCSERCKLIDLGEWANEGYRIPAASPSDGDDSELIDKNAS